MAKNRYIDTKFWDDNYISELDPIEKLLFLYLLTNPLTNICGIYEISLKRISFDTGIDKDIVIKIFNRFEKNNKIKYCNGWIAFKNWIKHQTEDINVKKGIEKGLLLSPKELIEWVNIKIEGSSMPLEGSSMPLEQPNLTKPEPEPEPEPNKKDKSFIAPTINEVTEYCIENGYNSELGSKVFNYYSSGDWKDSTGKQVGNWKQKCHAIWFKPENKVKQQTKPNYVLSQEILDQIECPESRS